MGRKPKRRIFIATGKKTTAKKAMSVAKRALNMVAGELKIIDTKGTGTAIPDGAGVLVQLTNMGQGNTDATRNGNQITLKKLEMRLQLILASAASSSQIRVMIVKDKQTNGAGISVDKLLESVANLQSLISPLESDNLKRFAILYDRVHVLNRPGISAVQSNVKYVSKFKKLNMRIQYNGTGTTITALNSNSLSLLFISNEPTNEPTVDFFVRLSYIDN